MYDFKDTGNVVKLLIPRIFPVFSFNLIPKKLIKRINMNFQKQIPDVLYKKGVGVKACNFIKTLL